MPRRDAAFLESLYEEERARGLVILAIAMDGPETVADVPSFARPGTRCRSRSCSTRIRTSRASTIRRRARLFSVLIDRTGRWLVRVREGYNPGDEGLVAADVRAALDTEPAGAARPR